MTTLWAISYYFIYLYGFLLTLFSSRTVQFSILFLVSNLMQTFQTDWVESSTQSSWVMYTTLLYRLSCIMLLPIHAPPYTISTPSSTTDIGIGTKTSPLGTLSSLDIPVPTEINWKYWSHHCATSVIFPPAPDPITGWRYYWGIRPLGRRLHQYLLRTTVATDVPVILIAPRTTLWRPLTIALQCAHWDSSS